MTQTAPNAAPRQNSEDVTPVTQPSTSAPSDVTGQPYNPESSRFVTPGVTLPSVTRHAPDRDASVTSGAAIRARAETETETETLEVQEQVLRQAPLTLTHPEPAAKKEPTEADKVRTARAIARREASERYLDRWRTLRGDPKARLDEKTRGVFGRAFDARGLPDLLRALEGLHSDAFTAAWPMLQCLSEASIQRGLAQAMKSSRMPPVAPAVHPHGDMPIPTRRKAGTGS